MSSQERNEDEELDPVAVIERYMILLLGVVDRAIPSQLHLQKELCTVD